MRAAGAAVLAASLAMPAAGRAAGTTERVGVGQGRAQADPAMSAGGRFAAFLSSATNLTRGGANSVAGASARAR